MKKALTLLFLLGSLLLKAQSPTAQFSVSSLTQCVNNPIVFNNSSTNGGSAIVSQVWDFGDGTSSTAINPSHTYSNAGTYTVILVVTDANGNADSEVKTNYLTINPTPISDFTFQTDGCSLPVVVTFTNTTSGGLNYEWDFGNGLSSTSPNPSIVTYMLAGTYSAKLISINSNGCSDTVVYPIIISDFHTNFNLPSSACAGSSIPLTDASTFGVNNWNWTLTGSTSSNSNLQNPSASYNNPGTYIVSLTSQDTNTGCIDSLSKSISIQAIPIPSFSGGPFTGCAPQTIGLTNTSNDNTASYVWNFGDGNTFNGINPPPHTYFSDGSYTISLSMTDNNNCSDSISQTNYVMLAPPTISFTADVTQGCDPLVVQFTPNATSLDPIVDWYWDFGDGTTFSGQTPPAHTFAAGVYDISLQVTTQNGCTANQFIPQYISTGHIDLVDFGGNPQIQCAKTDVNFTNLSIISVPHNTNEVSYLWSFGDGGTSTLQNPTYTYALDTGYFDVRLIVSFRGCTDTLTKTNFQYILGPISKFTPSQTLFCNPNSLPVSLHVSDSSKIGVYPDDAYMIWDWGDGSTSLLDDPDFDDADLGSTSHNYAAYGSYTIKQIIYNYTTGCADSTTSVVNISSTAAALTVANDSVCVGTPLALQSNSTSSHPFGTYIWQVSDGGTATGVNTNYTFQNFGTYSIQLIATNTVGCSDSATISPIIALSTPLAAINPANAIGCVPFTVTFSNTSSPTANGVSLSSFSYYFPDDLTTQITSDISNPVVHTFLANGNFPVALTVTDQFGCISNPTYSNVYTAVPTASYTASAVICEGDTITTTNLSSGNNPLSYSWYLDGTFISSAFNYSVSFNEPALPAVSYHDHTLNLIATDVNGCEDTISKTISVSTPIADISVVLSGAASNSNGDFICPPVFADFTDQSSVYGSISSWAWNFGDGKTSQLQSPDNTYVLPGTYSSSLTIIDSYGCTDDTTLLDNLTILGPTANPSWTEYANTCGIYASFDLGNTTNVDAILWNLGDGTIENDSTFFTHLYDSVGTYSPTVTIYDTNNCAINYPLGPINLASPPQMLISINGDALLCYGDANGTIQGSISGGTPPYQVTLIQTGATQTVNTFGGSFSLSGLSGGVNGGPASYSVSVADASGLPGFPSCDAVSPSVIILEPEPIQITSTVTNIECQLGSSGSIQVQVTGGTAPYIYNWSNGATTNLLSSLNPGTYTITISDANGTTNGCSMEMTYTIEPCQTIIIPTAITPNENGVNDKWELIGLDVLHPNNKVFIYNRWGALVFESTKGNYASNPWDGTYKNESLPVGSYFYIIHTNVESDEELINGTVSILKNN